MWHFVFSAVITIKSKLDIHLSVSVDHNYCREISFLSSIRILRRIKISSKTALKVAVIFYWKGGGGGQIASGGRSFLAPSDRGSQF